jgi:glycine/D-amino acid oxidase-like deaminating enzyme
MSDGLMLLGTMAIGASTGGLAGAIVALRLRNRPAERAVVDVDDESFPEAAARHAAESWCEKIGEPEAAPLVTRKLRLGWELQQRRARRTRA